MKTNKKLLLSLVVLIIANLSPSRISAQDYLIKFYSDFGFQDTGKKYLEDDIPHTEMARK